MKKSVSTSRAHCLINTGCVLLITSKYKDEENVMTLAWQTPLSSDPLLVGIAVAESHFTAELINKSREFVINIPGMELFDQVNKCGKVSGRNLDKFKEFNITPIPGHKVDAPLIDECIGHIECELVSQYTTGDHIFFVGKAVDASAREDLFVSTRWGEHVKLIHHLCGNEYYTNGKRRTF